MKFLIILSAVFTLFISNAQAEKPEPSIHASGYGEVTVEPDTATITVSVEHRGKEMKDVRNKATQSVANALSILKGFNIKDSDIHTTRITLRPEYDYQRNKDRRLTGYYVSRGVNVIIRDIEELGLILEKLMNAGINNVSSPQFSSSKANELKRQAIKLAAADAKANAQAAASGLSIEVGDVVSLNVNSGYHAPRPMENYRGMAKSAMVMDEAAASKTYQAGDIKYTANVSGNFAVKQ